MNQQTVVDVIPIDLFTIERRTCGDTGVSMWVVIGHGDDDRTQRFDSYNTLDEAEKAYPDAVTLPNGEPDSDWDKEKRRIWNEAKTNPSYKDHS